MISVFVPRHIEYGLHEQPILGSRRQQRDKQQNSGPRTWIFCFPNSFAKLWLNALCANLPAENALLVTFPLRLAVAPVKINVPLLPSSSIAFSWNAKIAWRENAKGALMLVSSTALRSSSVTSRKALTIPATAFQTATRISALGALGQVWDLIRWKLVVTSE